MKRVISGNGNKVEIDDLRDVVVYSLYVGGLRKLHGQISKKPGWKIVWDDTLGVLTKLSKELEGGTGLQSRAFQHSPSTEPGLYTDSVIK